MTAIEYLKAKPMAGSVVVGLLASLCCGGSLSEWPARERSLGSQRIVGLPWLCP
jgi:hypothetical protein